MKTWRKRILAAFLSVAVILTGVPGTLSTMAKKAEAATAVGNVPIICYTTAYSNVSTYTGINGSYTGYICKGDRCTILRVYESGWVYVSYPVRRGTRSAYAHSSSFFCNVDFSTATTRTGRNMTVYRKADCSSSIGTVYGNDNVIVVGTANGNTQIIYPIASGYKMGFVRGNITAQSSNTSTNTGFASLKLKYPSGSYWNGSYRNKAWQCHGFALTLGYERTGVDPYSWKKVYNLNSLKPGDIICCNRPHTIMVTGVSGNTITYVDCNWVATNKVCWDQTISRSKITSKFKGLRYVMVSPR